MSKALAIRLAKELARKQRPYCEFCGATDKQLHANHILDAGWPATAADPLNFVVLCAANHKLSRDSWHRDPVQFGRWFDERWPGRYDQLRKIAEAGGTPVWSDVVASHKETLKPPLTS